MASSSTPAGRNHGPHFAAGTCPIRFGCTMREKREKYEEKALLCGCLLPGAFLTACGLASQASVAALVERDVQALETLAGEIALAGAAGDAEYPGVDRISYDSRTGQVQFECGVSGFASQTSYNGFYYSSGDVPLGFGGWGYDARSVRRGAGKKRRGTTGITPRGCAAAGITTKCISDGRAAAAHLTQARFLRTISFGISLNDKGEETT